MEQKTLDALSSALYLSRLTLQGQTADTDDKRLRASGLYPDWAAGVHKAGEVYNAEGQTWECIQNYDNGVYPEIVPGNPAWGTFHRPYHGATPETARAFVQPTGAHDTYKPGEYAWFEGTLYQRETETAYSPAEYAAAWKEATA